MQQTKRQLTFGKCAGMGEKIQMGGKKCKCSQERFGLFFFFPHNEKKKKKAAMETPELNP